MIRTLAILVVLRVVAILVLIITLCGCCDMLLLTTGSPTRMQACADPNGNGR